MKVYDFGQGVSGCRVILLKKIKIFSQSILLGQEDLKPGIALKMKIKRPLFRRPSVREARLELA